MKALIESKGHRIRLEKEKNSRFIKIDEQREVLQKYVKAETRVNEARVYYAASKICALVRGFMARIVARKERIYYRAIKLIQKIMKGKLGRIRWKREYWRSISVVKSDSSLKEILERSRMIREKTKLGRFPYHWQEYFDPLTNSFWYYNRATRQNTWEVPLCFQESLICTWNGYQAFGALTTSKPCRAVFKHLSEYHNHMRSAHKWVCVACFQSNTGMDFPTCSLCGNKFSEDGVDGEKEMKKAVKEVHEAIKTFLEKDLNVKNTGIYRIRDRMIDIASEQRKIMDQMMAEQAVQSNTSDDDSSVGGGEGHKKTKGRRESMTHTVTLQHKSMLINALTEAYFEKKGTVTVGAQSSNDSTLKLPPIPSSSSKPPTASNSTALVVQNNNQNTKKGFVTLPTGSNTTKTMKGIPTPMDTQLQHGMESIPQNVPDDTIAASTMVPYASRTTRRIFDDQAWITSGGLAGEVARYKDPLEEGLLSIDDFDLATSAHDHATLQRKRLQRILLMQQQLHGGKGDGTEEMIRFLSQQDLDGGDSDEDESEQLSVSTVGNNAKRASSKKASGASSQPDQDDDKTEAQGPLPKLLVCPRFIEGTCTLTTCPMAHPGLRDSAQIYYKIKRLAPKDSLNAAGNNGGSAANKPADRIRIPYVFVCAEHTQFLEDPLDNDDNSTVDYNHASNQQSTALKSYQTGETNAQGLHTSCPRHANCPNYHVYIRPSTEEIIRRIYPLSFGIKEKTFYHNHAHLKGFVKNDVFDGYGRMHWSTGAVYLGDWVGEQRQGFGIYRNKNGDEYVGQFHAGKKHGWGIYTSVNGEQYIGQWQEGKMHGVGMLKHINGDVYQGSFARGMYEGIGYFQQATGDCYLGYHHENYAHGLGIESRVHKTVDGHSEKYKGYFEKNARHGRGCCYYRYHNVKKPNQQGAKFAIYMGQWYRGVCDGQGIFQVSNGDRYVGAWAGGKKEGIGRYTFGISGDFYDGEFHKDKAQGMGIYYHSNGNIYKGQWLNDMRNGRGTYNFANGSKYTGHWADNRIHMKGKFDFANGAFYRGEFSFNVKQGRGIYTWANGTIYKGQFFAEKLSGMGEMQYINGHRYVGQWDDNRKNGKGIFYYSNDSGIYEGYFVNDLRHGKGKLTLLPGTGLQESYEGDWSEDQWHGQGKYIYTYTTVKPLEDQMDALRLKQQRLARQEELQEQQAIEAHQRAKKLAASFALVEREDETNNKGKKSGKNKDKKKGNKSVQNDLVPSSSASVSSSVVANVKGAVERYNATNNITSSNNTNNTDLGGVLVWYYEGAWEHNIRTGHGLLYFTDHSYYRGEFQRDQFWGKGVYVNPLAQTQYEGMWRANMRHGMGTSLEPDGSIYTGEYFSNMKQGEGKLIRPDGSIYMGTWDANTILGMGRVQIPVGDPQKKDGLKKVITCKVFGY